MNKQKKTVQSQINPARQAPVVKPITAQDVTQHFATSLLENKWAKWIGLAIVAALTLLVYINSAGNQYVLDDHGIIKANKITKAGTSWENIKVIFSTSHRKGDVSDLEHSLYRPVAKVIFAAEYGWGDGKPEYMHKWNIAYMMLCCMLLYWLIYLATKRNWILALAIAGLYAVHPIHSEAVANIKSLDEVLGAIGVFGALICFHYYAAGKSVLLLPIALLSYCIGIFSKESTIVAVALVPLYLYYFTDAKLKHYLACTAVMVIGAALFLYARNEAIGWFLKLPAKDPSALDNVLAMTKLDQTKVGGYQMHLFIPTVIYLMGYYVYTLFIPYPLSCDYSYASVNVEGLDSMKFWMSFVMFAALIYFTIKTIKKKNIIGFGILWFLIASSIISNLFIVIGTSFGERLMFLPSVGWCIAVVGALYYLFGYAKSAFNTEGSLLQGLSMHKAMLGVLAIVGALYGWKTCDRNADWFKDYTLYSRDVQFFDNSTHLLFYWGNHLSSSEYQEILKSQGKSDVDIKNANLEAIATFKKSMGIFPALPSDGYNQYGKAFYNLGNLDSADFYYRKAHIEDTTNPVFLNNLGTIYFQRVNSYKRMDYYDSASKYFFMAYKRDTTMIDYMNNLGAITGTLGQSQNALNWFYKAYKADSLSEGAILSCRSLAVTYKTLGDSNNMRAWNNKAAEINTYRMGKLQSGGF